MGKDFQVNASKLDINLYTLLCTSFAVINTFHIIHATFKSLKNYQYHTINNSHRLNCTIVIIIRYMLVYNYLT